ncbi:hypothetical protein HDE_13273 [Halotydeus destructor]|nr:hypothetical protein HDE_13273 [Halotydeus destructor]
MAPQPTGDEPSSPVPPPIPPPNHLLSGIIMMWLGVCRRCEHMFPMTELQRNDGFCNGCRNDPRMVPGYGAYCYTCTMWKTEDHIVARCRREASHYSCDACREGSRNEFGCLCHLCRGPPPNPAPLPPIAAPPAEVIDLFEEPTNDAMLLAPSELAQRIHVARNIMATMTNYMRNYYFRQFSSMFSARMRSSARSALISGVVFLLNNEINWACGICGHGSMNASPLQDSSDDESPEYLGGYVELPCNHRIHACCFYIFHYLNNNIECAYCYLTVVTRSRSSLHRALGDLVLPNRPRSEYATVSPQAEMEVRESEGSFADGILDFLEGIVFSPIRPVPPADVPAIENADPSVNVSSPPRSLSTPEIPVVESAPVAVSLDDSLDLVWPVASTSSSQEQPQETAVTPRTPSLSVVIPEEEQDRIRRILATNDGAGTSSGISYSTVVRIATTMRKPDSDSDDDDDDADADDEDKRLAAQERRDIRLATARSLVDMRSCKKPPPQMKDPTKDASMMNGKCIPTSMMKKRLEDEIDSHRVEKGFKFVTRKDGIKKVEILNRQTIKSRLIASLGIKRKCWICGKFLSFTYFNKHLNNCKGVTPDGVAFKDGKVHRIVEVKTPSDMQHLSPYQMALALNDVIVDHDISLKPRCKTWYQAQLFMMVMNIDETDILYYTAYDGGDYLRITLKKEPDMMQGFFLALERIYRDIVVPLIYQRVFQ